MQSAHSIVAHIAGFTSQRDIDLLIFSLLKSINSIIKPKRASVLRFDYKYRPIKEFTYINEVCTVIQDDIQFGDSLSSAIDYMQATNSEKYIESAQGDYLAVYQMSRERQFPTYIVLNIARKISHVEDFLLSGMLGIYKNFSDLLIDAQTDELTGLANRKTFEASINRVHALYTKPPEEFHQEKRKPVDDESNSYWLTLIDIDHFKKVNDTYGHLYGDEVLIKLAQIMKMHFRGEDLIYRLGGEEFAVLLRCATKAACATAIERFRTMVEATDFPGVGQITVSGGAVKLDRDTFHVTLLDYADQALYCSKKNGRNRMTFFDELIENGIARKQIFQSGDIDLF